MQKINNISQSIIEYSFCLLFFFVPLILTPFNYELFEYNKMMLTYTFTTVIVFMWLIKMVINRQIKIGRTPLDIPLLLFLASQVISTFLSIDPHVSIWGYYSRFNGGLLSTISYILLYFAFVTNFPKEKIERVIKFILASAFLVSIYGILEHLGIDKDIWVQDVQNRVFSTLGQPNWLAAYLAVLIPMALGILIYYFPNLTTIDSESKHQRSNIKDQKQNVKYKNNFSIQAFLHLCILAFFAVLLFTKSRSGIIGFVIADIIFWLILFYKYQKNIIKPFIILNSLFLILIFFFGVPFQQINRFTFSELTKNNQQPTIQQSDKPLGTSVIEVGITESGKIREIVWKGAIDIFKHYPLFGSGVETFAFSYYKFRPVEHNMTSEWDFLYNKAHNEYLNCAATTGAFGLGSYLLIIGVFIWWNIKRFKLVKSDILILALFSGWLSILITNFFGFSVVIIQLFFFLIPALLFVLTENIKPAIIFSKIQTPARNALQAQAGGSQHLGIQSFNIYQKILVVLFFILPSYFLIQIARLWYADTLFAKGFHASSSQEYALAYLSIRDAILINDREPFYYDELSLPAAQLSAAALSENDSTTAAKLAQSAILSSDMAISISPNNVNFWKNRTRVFYALAQEDEKYYQDAYESLLHAKDLSLTDPKIRYNLAILMDRMDKRTEAINEMIEVTKLKPDYRDAYLALALFYQQEKQKDKAVSMLEFILTKLNPNDEEAKKMLEELK